jgi:dihydroxyacid dehydratase/phosphogluconate dehydratase
MEIVRLDGFARTLNVGATDEEIAERPPAVLDGNGYAMGRDRFHIFRANAATAEEGAGVCAPPAVLR